MQIQHHLQYNHTSTHCMRVYRCTCTLRTFVEHVASAYTHVHIQCTNINKEYRPAWVQQLQALQRLRGREGRREWLQHPCLILKEQIDMHTIRQPKTNFTVPHYTGMTSPTKQPHSQLLREQVGHPYSLHATEWLLFCLHVN